MLFSDALISYGNFQYPIIPFELRSRNVNGQATLNCLVEIMKQFLEGLTLRGASGNGWNFCPETTFLCLAHYYFDFHSSIIRLLAENRRASNTVTQTPPPAPSVNDADSVGRSRSSARPGPRV